LRLCGKLRCDRLKQAAHRGRRRACQPPVGLASREIDALQPIARLGTGRDVARKLGISPSTAHGHFEKAKRKIKVSTRAEAIAVSLAIVGALKKVD
jgi:DNA-binding CsgD family transcriptional regulator